MAMSEAKGNVPLGHFFCIKYKLKAKLKMVKKMKISFIKYEKDTKEYNIPRLLGMNIEEIKEPEEIDKKIEELKEKQYTTIIIPNELASFSEKIETQYKQDSGINIIITPNKNA